VASTYGRSYRFPTSTVLKGLLENACGFPPDSLPFSDSVSLSLIVLSADTTPFESLDKIRIFSANPFQTVKEQPHKVDFGNLGGATYVRQYLPPRQRYLVYAVSAHPQYPIEQLENRLKQPLRSLFLGQSDSLVAIEDVRIVNLLEDSTDVVDSWVPVTNEIMPVDRRQIRGRVPLRFNRVLESDRRQFTREDVLVAVGFSEPVRLTQPIRCLKDGSRSVIFIPQINF
jgi:hypothetical protein